MNDEALKNLLAISELAKHALGQYQWILDQVPKTSALEMSKIITTQRRLVDFDKARLSPAFEAASSFNQSIERFLAANTARINGILQQSAFQRQALVDRIAGSMPADVIWSSHLIDIARFSILSQTSLSQISWEQMGNALDIQRAVRNSLQSVFLDFSQSYSDLFDSLERRPSVMMPLPPVISKLPAFEFFNSVNVIDTITVNTGKDAELEEEIQQATEEVRGETEARLEALLTDLNPGFLILLQGARQSIDSKNPDHIRHFSTSLRELFTHVLHTLAPDNKMKEWSEDTGYYQGGKPTRRARLLFICRGLNYEPFSEFVEKDIDANLAFLDLFQQGTHEVIPKYSDSQLKAMLVRGESTLRYLLEIWCAS